MKRGYIFRITLFFFFYRVCASIQPEANLGNVLHLSEINENDHVEIFSEGEAMSGSLYGTVRKYHCKVDIGQESDFLVYGTKSWSFPLQDVTLKLDFPSNNHKYDSIAQIDYVLTEVKVVLYINGDSSKGYITSGGILQRHINMAFVFSNITSLTYQWYLYGVPDNLAVRSTNNTIDNFLC